MTEDPRRPQPSREHFNDLVEADGYEELPEPVQDLLENDMALSKIDSDDRRYLRLLAENVVHFSEERYPPEESLVQGDVGAALLEDPDYNMNALSAEQKAEIEASLLTYFTRISRSKGGWQQDKLNEGIQTKRIEDERNEAGGSSGSSGGLLSRIFKR
jgi:hypothetical protein